MSRRKPIASGAALSGPKADGFRAPTKSRRAYHQPAHLFRGDRHGHSGNLYLDRTEMTTAGEVDRLPVVAAKGEVGGRGGTVHDAAELLPGLVHDPHAAGATAIDVAFDIDLHAVGHAGFRAAQIGEDAVGVP